MKKTTYMNHIQYHDLLKFNIPAIIIDIWNETDPIDIYEQNGLFCIRGVIDADDLTRDDLIECIGSLGQFHIKPEYLSMWSSDVDEETVIGGEQVFALARNLEKDPCDILKQLELI